MSIHVYNFSTQFKKVLLFSKKFCYLTKNAEQIGEVDSSKYARNVSKKKVPSADI